MNKLTSRVLGIHHVTALASDPRRNLDFYRGILGLRLVKKTVNFDDPGTYHFYFGDETGSPGTILTFFPWPLARRGAPGAGQVSAISFTVPEGSLAAWSERLTAAGVSVGAPGRRFGRSVLVLADPDGLVLELVESPAAADIKSWAEGPVSTAEAIRGIDAVTVSVRETEPTAAVLEALGFEFDDSLSAGRTGERVRFRAAAGELGQVVDLKIESAPQGRIAAGSIHHVAFRAADDAAQAELGRRATSAGLLPTPVQNRQYFRSIYFREPGGVLFEIATDGPGFTFDEPLAELGRNLKLPAALEPRRPQIEQALPSLEASVVAGVQR